MIEVEEIEEMIEGEVIKVEKTEEEVGGEMDKIIQMKGLKYKEILKKKRNLMKSDRGIEGERKENKLINRIYKEIIK